MGRIFLEHMGGVRIFACANCEAPLTNRTQLISTRFTGATGRAFLFNKVNMVSQEPANTVRVIMTFQCLHYHEWFWY